MAHLKSEFIIQNWKGLARNYLLSFHQHSRLARITSLFFIHIPGYSATVHFRSFVFNNIPGYTFIFAINFLLYDSLQ